MNSQFSTYIASYEEQIIEHFGYRIDENTESLSFLPNRIRKTCCMQLGEITFSKYSFLFV